MFRYAGSIIVLAIMLFHLPLVSAQEASPMATPGTMDGVTVELLGFLEVAPGVSVPVARVDLAPEAALPPHTSPVPAVAQVQSGSVSFAVISGIAQRAQMTVPMPTGTPEAGMPEVGTPEAAMESGTPTAESVEAFATVEAEQLIIGEETSLDAGQGVTFGPDVVHTFRNTGTEPAVLLIIGEFPPDQPIFQFAGAEATPAATPAS